MLLVSIMIDAADSHSGRDCVEVVYLEAHNSILYLPLLLQPFYV